jgi:phospholipid/cholesterol/gamma-HCH transport system ATP-binding protein
MSQQPSSPEPYIQFQEVSKAFGSNRVLDRVTFHVFPGETLCILGRSGVGKSVSLHHIMGFLKPDSGRVIVAYEDITHYDERLSLCVNVVIWMKNRSIRSLTACWKWLV